MARALVTRRIDAPLSTVFRTVAESEHFSQAIPHIVKIEMLSDVTSGVGTRFREPRLMKGKEAMTELEITELSENEHIRLVADSHGTIWDTLFSVREHQGAIELTMDMEARPHSFMARLTVPFVMKMITGALEGDMDAVKAYCEKRTIT